MLNAYFGRLVPLHRARRRRGAPDRRRRDHGGLRQGGRHCRIMRSARRAPRSSSSVSRRGSPTRPRRLAAVPRRREQRRGARRAWSAARAATASTASSETWSTSRPGCRPGARGRRADRRGDVPAARHPRSGGAAAAAPREGQGGAGHRLSPPRRSIPGRRDVPCASVHGASRPVAPDALRTLRAMSNARRRDAGTGRSTRTAAPRHVGGVGGGIARALPHAVEDMFTDRCTQYAAAIAYRVLFSLFPLTIAARVGLRARAPGRRAPPAGRQRADSTSSPSPSRGRANIQQSIEQIAIAALGDRPHLARRAALGRVRDDGVDPARARGGIKVERGRPAAHAKLVDFILVAAAGSSCSSSSGSRPSPRSSAGRSIAVSGMGRASPRPVGIVRCATASSSSP